MQQSIHCELPWEDQGRASTSSIKQGCGGSEKSEVENVRPLETDRQRTEPQDHDLRDATDELVSLCETGLPSPDSRTSLSQRFQFFMLLEGSGGLAHLN